ncbi:MAG TPA: site-specific integrase [Steroidobacteraceae bacterium]
MATISRNPKTGAVVAQVRIRPFRPTQETFRVAPGAKLADVKKEARAWAEAEEKRLRALRVKGGDDIDDDISRRTVGEVIGAYLEDPKVTSLKTFDDVDRLATWWLAEHKATRIIDFGVKKIFAAREKLVAEKVTPATVNRYVDSMRACWNWARNSGKVPQDRAWPTKLRLDENNERKRFLDDSELAALLKAAESNPVLHAAILLSVGTGMRQGELLRLTWKDVDLDGGKVVLLETKNGTPRTVHVPATAVAALRKLRTTKTPVTSPVFMLDAETPLNAWTLENRWSKIRDAAGLEDFKWHDLRHSCASFLARRGASLLEISSVLGHKSLSMVKRYAHLTQGKPVTGHTELDALLSGK